MGDTTAQRSVTVAAPPKDPHRILLEQPHLIDEALADGVGDALMRHKERVQNRSCSPAMVVQQQPVHKAATLAKVMSEPESCAAVGA